MNSSEYREKARETARFRILPGSSRIVDGLSTIFRDYLRDLLDRAPYHLDVESLQVAPVNVLSSVATLAALDSAMARESELKAELRVGYAVYDEVRSRALEKAEDRKWSAAKGMTLKGSRRAAHRERKRILELEPVPRARAHDLGSRLLALFEVATGAVYRETYREVRGKRTKSRTRLRIAAEIEEHIDQVIERVSRGRPSIPATDQVPPKWAPRDRRFLRGSRTIREIPQAVLDAADALGSVGWRVNPRVLEVAQELAVTRGVPGLPIKPGDEILGKRRWGRVGRRAREYADMAWAAYRDSRKLLATAKQRAGSRFHLPHVADRRGRLYAAPLLSPLSPDLGRGLLEFADGSKLVRGGPGHRELGEYGATLWGLKETHRDARYTWAKTQGTKLAASVAQDPTGDTSWTSADEPWEFLAWAFEWDALEREGSIETRLPVYLDGTANGLQVAALLLQDEVAGAQVNLVASELPRDFYLSVVERVQETLKDVYETEAKEILRLGLVTRKLVKRTVLCVLFAQGRWGQRETIAEALIEHFYANDVRRKAGIRRMAWVLREHIEAAVSHLAPSLERFQAFTRALAKETLRTREDFVFRGPTGFLVDMEYTRRKGSRKVKLFVDDAVTLGASNEWVTDVAATLRGAAPNVTHAVDAAILHRTVSRFRNTGPVATRHDGFGTYATLVPALREEILGSIHELDLGRWFQDLAVDTLDPRESECSLPPTPPPGSLDPAGILQAHWAYH